MLIILNDTRKAWLEAEAARLGLSQIEVLRRLIDAAMEREK